MPQLPYVLTLVGDPLPDSVVDSVCQRFSGDHIRVLSSQQAVDISFTNPPPAQVNAELADLLASLRIDGFAQTVENRRKQLLIADMDSTIIDVECVDEMAAKFGIKPQIAAITDLAMRGEIEFAEALRRRVELLAGMPAAHLVDVFDNQVAIRPGARTLVATMAANSAFTALVSGGFTYFTERVVKAVGFHTHQANRLEIRDGRLTGKVIEPILDANAKATALNRLLSVHKCALEDCMTIGDGANDIAMLQMAGMGVAFHATPKTRAVTPARIDHTDLTTALFFQGYAAEDFVTG